MDVKDISLTIVFSSLYAILVVFLAPISFGPIQLRVADCMLPLSILFGYPLIIGATIGCFIGNLIGGVMYFGEVNMLDVVFGPIANLIATFVIYALRRWRLGSCIVGSLIVGFIVGGYLWLLTPPPSIGITAPAWAAMIVSITLSSLIAMAMIGYGILNALSRPNVIRSLKSMGLKIIED